MSTYRINEDARREKAQLHARWAKSQTQVDPTLAMLGRIVVAIEQLEETIREQQRVS